MNAAEILEQLADAIAGRVAEKLTNASKPPERIPLDEVAAHGAPGRRWVEARAREGRIVIRGPRGGRFVDSGELAALLSSTTIRRRGRAPVERPAGTDLAADARAAVAELVARMAAK
jgi:hypothetical protein